MDSFTELLFWSQKTKGSFTWLDVEYSPIWGCHPIERKSPQFYASLRNGVSLQNDPTTYNVEKWRIPVFISEMFTTIGWFSHSVINVARQTSTGDYYSTVSEVANHQNLFYMKKFESFGNSISQVFLTEKFQILHVNTPALEVVAGSSSPWVWPGHIDLLADRRVWEGKHSNL